MGENNIEITTNLNTAAFLLLQGAEIAGFSGKHHYDCKVVVKTRPEILATVTIGMIRFQDYMKARKKIKLKIRQAYDI